MTNPIPKRAMKAAVIAAFLSGKVMGSMIPTSIAPNARPQIAPRTTLDMFASSILLNSPRNNLHHESVSGDGLRGLWRRGRAASA